MNYSTYQNKVIKTGRASVLVFIVESFLPALCRWFVFGLRLEFRLIFKAYLNIAAVFLAFWLIEPFQFYAMIGLPGVYMGQMCGSIVSLRLPAMLAVRQVFRSYE